jgi:hypothetical protein
MRKNIARYHLLYRIFLDNACLREVGSVQEETHEASRKSTSNGNGHDPGEEEETNTLEVDSLDSTVAKTDTNGSTSDAHRGGDGKLVLGEDKDGDGGTQLHRAAWRDSQQLKGPHRSQATYLGWGSDK